MFIREIKNRPLEIRSKNFRETEVQQLTLNQSRNAHYSRYVLMLQLQNLSIVYDFCLYSQDPDSSMIRFEIGWRYDWDDIKNLPSQLVGLIQDRVTIVFVKLRYVFFMFFSDALNTLCSWIWVNMYFQRVSLTFCLKA